MTYSETFKNFIPYKNNNFKIKKPSHLTAFLNIFNSPDVYCVRLFTCFVMEDLRFAALLGWIMLFFAILSIRLVNFGSIATASSLLVVVRILLSAVRMVRT